MSGKTVYSTEKGDMRQKPGKKKKDGSSQGPSDIKRDGIVRVRRESKGRSGKTVTAVYGVPLSGQDLSALGTRLKQQCGSGGTVKDGVVIIQGNNTDRVIALLKEEGFTVKRSGG